MLRPAHRSEQNGARALCEEHAQVAISTLRDAPKNRAITGRNGCRVASGHRVNGVCRGLRFEGFQLVRPISHQFYLIAQHFTPFRLMEINARDRALVSIIVSNRGLGMSINDYVRWFSDIRVGDVALVGGKNASLGELYSTLSKQGVRVPNGFALTADAYWDALTAAKAWERLHALLDDLDKRQVDILAQRAAEAREIVYQATATGPLREQVDAAYRQLEAEYGANLAVAVRSSATAEDLPSASFAGQHESFLNISGADDLFETCRRCFASIFTDRAISYRVDKGFDHFKVALSVGVMKMVRSDRAASGVTFTLDTESGCRDVVFITGVYGLGENIVQGTVDPDEFYVHKPTFRQGYRAVLSRSLGGKQMRMVYARGHGRTKNVSVPKSDRERFCITDAEVLALADHAIRIEDHYSSNAGHPMPMDIEWAKDADDEQIYIIQARPETVASRRSPTSLETYSLKESAPALVTGRAVGEKIAFGPVRVIADARELATFRPGEILVAESTSPDWEPVMKIAAAIVTERGG